MKPSALLLRIALALTWGCLGAIAVAQPNESPANDSTTSATMRVLSLNLHTYQEAEPLAKLAEVAAGASALRADVLLLQEVGEHITDPAKPNAGGVIADALIASTGDSWTHVWEKAHVGFDEYHEGVSILSRYPIEGVQVHQLSGGALARIAISATVETPQGPVVVCTTHTSWPPNGGAEVQKLVVALTAREGDDPRAIILAGDFNATPENPQMSPIAAAGYVDVALSLGNAMATMGNPPQKRIDYQFMKPVGSGVTLRPTSIMTVFDGRSDDAPWDPIVSDHIGLFGVYEWVEAP